MGKYIYESHMGGLYTTDVEQDFDLLYCEECGDRDWCLGYARNFHEAWNLLKDKTDLFDDTKCIDCPYNEDYDYCNEKCEDFSKSGGYGLPFVMNFLYQEFPSDIKWHYIYLLIRNNDNDKPYYLAKCEHSDCPFGQKHSFPVAVCSDEAYVTQIARSLTVYGGQVDLSTMNCISIKHAQNSVVHIYECIDKKPENENWEEVASYFDDGWYGYFEENNLNLIESQELIFCDILYRERSE